MAIRVPTRNSSKQELNSFNLWLHQQPWYTQFLQQQGQNPARVQLSDQQRQQLQAVAAQNGVNLAGLDGMNFDPSANLNTPHGFASQPTWLKAVEIAAPVAAADFFTGGAVHGALQSGISAAFGGAPSVAPAAPSIMTGAGPISAAALPTIAGPATAAGSTIAAGAAPIAASVVPKVASTGFSLGKALFSLAPTAINAGTQYLAQRSATNANQRAVDAELAANREALDYTKQRDAQQRQDFLDTQNRNFGLYNEAQARLDPYRRFGLRSLDQLGRPIPGVGTLAARMG